MSGMPAVDFKGIRLKDGGTRFTDFFCPAAHGIISPVFGLSPQSRNRRSYRKGSIRRENSYENISDYFGQGSGDLDFDRRVSHVGWDTHAGGGKCNSPARWWLGDRN